MSLHVKHKRFFYTSHQLKWPSGTAFFCSIGSSKLCNGFRQLVEALLQRMLANCPMFIDKDPFCQIWVFVRCKTTYTLTHNTMITSLPNSKVTGVRNADGHPHSHAFTCCDPKLRPRLDTGQGTLLGPPRQRDVATRRRVTFLRHAISTLF